ncbi:hypothetical protein TEQG_01156 [Trichophyton equinum CBS 127.97]|uniref:Uncharacterized protein n=1 Tax=Trichophyton equinum (strain ATCC MYA-4606 / CBS 127.97) TaxID=559882 RepID=F2PJP9_TRIEC|nr:hypothetical protein TEQG_01156 [Trichophyton equinum CBS 127.97]
MKVLSSPRLRVRLIKPLLLPLFFGFLGLVGQKGKGNLVAGAGSDRGSQQPDGSATYVEPLEVACSRQCLSSFLGSTKGNKIQKSRLTTAAINNEMAQDRDVM